MSQTMQQDPMQIQIVGRISYPPGTTIIEVVVPSGCDAEVVTAALEGIDGILVSATTA